MPCTVKGKPLEKTCWKATSKSLRLKYGKTNPAIGRYGVNVHKTQLPVRACQRRGFQSYNAHFNDLNTYWFLWTLGNFLRRPGRRLFSWETFAQNIVSQRPLQVSLRKNRHFMAQKLSIDRTLNSCVYMNCEGMDFGPVCNEDTRIWRFGDFSAN